MPLGKRRRRPPSVPKTIDVVHGDLEDYDVDAINNTEDYFVYQRPEGYSRDKIEKLLGKNRIGNEKWTQAHVNHVIEHIEQKIAEVAAERAEKERLERAFERVMAEELRPPPTEYQREVLYPQLAITVVTIKGHRYQFWRDPKTGRFAKPKVPEQIPEKEVKPSELKKK